MVAWKVLTDEHPAILFHGRLESKALVEGEPQPENSGGEILPTDTI